ncbi:MAG: Dyp-type peroxidase, partial [Cellulomonas sp.]|nr:Dyp-type peroxidase [Cellulomonas sp.]
MVAFDLAPGVDREALVRLMKVWTEDCERLMAGTAPLADQAGELTALPASLTTTVGYGPGFFAAADLVDRAPSWLAPLPAFTVDRLEDRWSGGDLMVQVCGDDELAIAHTVRVLTVGASTFASVRWTQRGFRHAPGVTAPGATMRNLMGQLDGSHNVDPAATPDLVWHSGTDAGWLPGGTSMVVRRIRMDLDTWDIVDRASRESAMGRRLADGAPLTGTVESDLPDLDARDARGFTVIGPAAHVRRAAATT